MKPIESIAPVIEDKIAEHEMPHIVYDDWDLSPSSLELEEIEGEGSDLYVVLIAALVFVLVVFCVVLI